MGWLGAAGVRADEEELCPPTTTVRTHTPYPILAVMRMTSNAPLTHKSVDEVLNLLFPKSSYPAMLAGPGQGGGGSTPQPRRL